KRLIVTTDASPSLEDHRRGRQQYTDTPAQRYARVGDTAFFRRGIYLPARSMTRFRAELAQHFDFALIGAVHRPIQRPLALGVLRIRIGAILAPSLIPSVISSTFGASSVPRMASVLSEIGPRPTPSLMLALRRHRCARCWDD